MTYRWASLDELYIILRWLKIKAIKYEITVSFFGLYGSWTEVYSKPNLPAMQWWARGAPQLFATTAVRLVELVLSVRYELIASRSLCQFLCKIYAFWPFWMVPSCTRYVSYVGNKENLLGLVLRFHKIRTKKYVFYFEKYVFFAWYFVSIFHVFFFNGNKIVLSNSRLTWVFSTVCLGLW